MDWSLAALYVYMPDWPMALAKIAKAATKALRPAPQVRSEIGKRQDLTPLLALFFLHLQRSRISQPVIG